VPTLPLEGYALGQSAYHNVNEYIVLDPVGSAGFQFAAEKECRVEGLAIVTGEIMFDCPVKVLQIGCARAPFQVVAELVGQRLPGFLPPVESALQLGQRRERTMVENDPALHAFHSAPDLDRQWNAFAQRKNFRSLGVGHRSGGYDDLRNTIQEIRRHLFGEASDHGFEVAEPHCRTF
jgi:hypothetical protein